MYSGVVSDTKNAVNAHCYQTGDKQAVATISQQKLEPLAKCLGDKQFLVGDYVTWVDFFFFELLNLISMITETNIYKQFPTLDAYNKRVASLPKVAEYIASDKYKQIKLFNNKVAKINNQ